METIQKGFLSETVPVSCLNLLLIMKQGLTMYPKLAFNWQSIYLSIQSIGLQVCAKHKLSWTYKYFLDKNIKKPI